MVSIMKKCRLGNVLDVTRGTTLSGKYYSEEGTLIRLTLGNFDYPLNGFKKNTSKKDIYFKGPVKEEFILKKDDIITPLTEQKSGLLGETAKIPIDNIYIQSGDIGLIKVNEDKLSKSFAYYLISSSIIKKQLDSTAQQTKIRHTSPDIIKNCTVWLPPLDNQKKIAELLDNINNIIISNNNIISELKSLIKIIFNQWFLKFEFPNKKGKPYKSNNGKMIWNEELKMKIPEEWNVVELNSIFVEKPKSKIKVNDADGYGIYPFFTSGDSILKHSNFLVEGLNCFLNTGGNVDVKCYYGKATYSTDTWCITGIDGYEEYLFLYIFNIKKSLNNLFEGSALKHLNKNAFRSIKIILPPKKIMLCFKNIVQSMFVQISKNYEENNELKELKNFMLPLFMNGQLTFK